MTKSNYPQWNGANLWPANSAVHPRGAPTAAAFVLAAIVCRQRSCRRVASPVILNDGQALTDLGEAAFRPAAREEALIDVFALASCFFHEVLPVLRPAEATNAGEAH